MRYLFVLLTIPMCATSHGGTIRYDLPEFLGVHLYDAEAAADPFSRGVKSIVHTPFGMYEVDLATIVVEGRWSPGKAHGEGIPPEDATFDLLPAVNAVPNFVRGHGIIVVPPPPEFRLVRSYADPFVPPPNTNGGPFPGVSFEVTLGFSPTFVPSDPPYIGTSPGPYVIDEPMVLEIDEAYVLLSGANIVPEPQHFAMLAATALCVILGWAARRGFCSNVSASAYPILRE